MEGLVSEMFWSVILIVVCSSLVRVCDVMWVKPRRIQSKLSRQGITGPLPFFLYGNIQEIQTIQSTLIKSPDADAQRQRVSHHNWVHFVFPHLQRWEQQYGPTYMYSTGNKQQLYTSKPELLKELNLHKSLGLGKPSYLSKATEPLLGDGIIKANGHQWAHQRKLIAPQLFLHKVKGMLGLMEESTSQIIRKWESLITESKDGIVDIIIDQDLKSLSGDIISKACFGSSYSQGKHIFAKLRTLQEAISQPSLLFGLPNFRFLPTKSNREMWKLKREVDALILKVVKDRQQESQRDANSENDLLQMILDSAATDSDKHLKTNRFIVDNCKNIYFAGHETTALTASWVLMLLASHPEWQERIRAEIVEICGDQLRHCLLDLDKIRQFKTLTMVIQETLRLYGPAIIMAREAFEEMKLGGFVVPKGVHIWNLIPVLHRDPDNWGPDANDYKPERFANGISEACKYPQTYIPFGYGTRLCVGQTFAMLELKIVLSLILSKFSFSLSPNYHHSPVYRMVLMPEHGVRLLMKRV